MLGWLLAGALGQVACAARQDDPALVLVTSIQRACSEQDAGAVLSLTDLGYGDALGGVGRLGDDLRQLFAVHGALRLEVSELGREGDWLRGRAVLAGRALAYRGPLAWRLSPSPAGDLLASGLLTELRGVLYSLRLRRLGLEQSDLSRLGEAVSMHYRGPAGDREALLDRLGAEFEREPIVAVVIEGMVIEVEGLEARVEQAAVLVSRAGDRRVERRASERLTLRLEGTRWRIVEGLG
jgi:hypothetical protein